MGEPDGPLGRKFKHPFSPRRLAPVALTSFAAGLRFDIDRVATGILCLFAVNPQAGVSPRIEGFAVSIETGAVAFAFVRRAKTMEFKRPIGPLIC